MKRILTSLAMAAAVLLPGFAQNNPNRMIVSRGGQETAFNIDNISEISFANINGSVSCKIEVSKVSAESINLNVTPSADCASFLINVLPAVTVRQLVGNPVGAEAYLKSTGAGEYQGEFKDAQLTGMEMTAGVEYAVVTVSYDRYGCEGEVNAAYFKVPEKELIGDPVVTYKVVSEDLTSIKVDFDANEDVGGFAVVIGEKGELMKQYEQFAPMMGFSCVGDMVKGWGKTFPGNRSDSYTWTDLNPNTEYEIYLQAWDADDTYTPLQIIDVRTESKGGSGASVVTITPGDYVLADWGGEKLPSQFFTFTPNDQTWRYRFGVYTEEIYNENKEEIRSELCSEPDMPMAYWFFYDELTTDYQINPNTTVIVIGAGQNADGKWGDITEVKYTTPASVKGAPAKVASEMRGVNSRVKAVKADEKGKIPANSKIRLSKF